MLKRRRGKQRTKKIFKNLSELIEEDEFLLKLDQSQKKRQTSIETFRKINKYLSRVLTYKLICGTGKGFPVPQINSINSLVYGMIKRDYYLVSRCS